MTSRRKLVKVLKEFEQRGDVLVHNFGYFDFEPGMDIKLNSMKKGKLSDI